jgi:sialate O-acetylesterase
MFRENKMKISSSLKIIFGVILVSVSQGLYGNVILPALISNNMVLQQQSQVRIWGWANPYEKVTVNSSWNNKTYSAVGSRDARWEVLIETPEAGGPYSLSIKGNNTIALGNIMIGEVWVCAGQSNMEMCGNWGLEDIKAELPTAKNVNIRFFQIPKSTAAYPQDNLNAEWTICDSTTLKSFSAVGYFFGKNLNNKLNTPIGLIEASWGGTAAEVWTPDSIVNTDIVLKEAAAKIEPSGMCPYLPGYAYNAMIVPLTKYAIAGSIWYQGENNTLTASTYNKLFISMIDAWRTAWNNNFPFYFVQIAPYKYAVKNTGALLREAQTKSLACPKTGMVVITDLVTNIHDVHPSNKHDVGLRLSNWALAETYHKKDIVYKSPLYKNMSIKNNKVIVSFENAENGLLIKGKSVTELFIAGDDKVFYAAEAQLENNTIKVWSEKVQKPVAVRYGFSDTATGNLFSKDGLPVCPFRTDNWFVETK